MLSRHKLAWLSDEGWQIACKDAPPDTRRAISAWRHADWPTVVRRADADAGGDLACVGVALPPDSEGIKKRIPLRIPVAQVRKCISPLRIEAVLASVPPTWRRPLEALDADATVQGVSFMVYGSVALQSLTGLAYVTEKSDIDLLFYPVTHAQLAAGLAVLSVHANQLPLDGEIVFPSGQAVAWKEWMNALSVDCNPRVLVKEAQGVRLLRMGELLDSLKEAPCVN